MSLPDWLREQQEQHQTQALSTAKVNDDLSVKLGKFPYRLSLQSRISNSLDGRKRSLQMELFFHNEKTRPTTDAAILAVSVPFVDSEAVAVAKNERGYFAEKLFDYMAGRLSISVSENVLKQNLSVMVDKYLEREQLVNSPYIEAVRPASKANGLIAATINIELSKNTRNSNAQPKSKGYSPSGQSKGNGRTPLWKVPPIAMIEFLQNSGVINIVKREANTISEDNIYITMSGAENSKPVKMSVVKNPNDTRESLRYVFQHNRQGGSGALSLINELISSHGMLSKFAKGDPEETYNMFINSLPAEPDWSRFNIELKKTSIQSLGESAQARQPISFNPPKKTFEIAKRILCDWRGLSEQRVADMVKNGTIRSGDFHNAKRNNVSSGGFFYYNKIISPDKPIHSVPDEQVERFQRMMKLKEKGHDKLKKFASGGNKGYFAGTPKESADVLWLTEAAIDADSMKDLNQLCEQFGVAPVEDNCIALLSTSGLKEFLAQRFGAYVKTSKDKRGNITSTTLEVESRSLTLKDLDAGDKGMLSRYFSTPIHFVTDGTNEADVALSKLKDIAEFSVGNSVSINVVGEAQQRGMIRGFNEKQGSEGINKVFDKTSVEDFMKTHRLSSRYDSDKNQMVWSVSVESIDRKSFNSLTPQERQNLQVNAAAVMSSMLGVKTLGNAFDNDKAGQDVGRELEMMCKSLNIPYSTFAPAPTKIELRSKSINVKDHNDVLMSARGLIAEGRNDECKQLLNSWANSSKLAPEVKHQVENNKGNDNAKYGR
tara:strand:+ start:1846 stop:4161 length:2316 start_codon:yes stop_codon:yes gene_type:complete